MLKNESNACQILFMVEWLWFAISLSRTVGCNSFMFIKWQMIAGRSDQRTLDSVRCEIDCEVGSIEFLSQGLFLVCVLLRVFLRKKEEAVPTSISKVHSLNFGHIIVSILEYQIWEFQIEEEAEVSGFILYANTTCCMCFPCSKFY